MKNLFKIIAVILLLIVGAIVLTPDKTLRVTMKELAEEAEISPFLANFIVNTKVGRKVGYLVMREKLKEQFNEGEEE